MKVKILGKYWTLQFVPRLAKGRRGDIDAPDVVGKRIRILRRLRGEHKLDTILHEAFHGLGWHLDEEAVDEAARDFARILWRLGYRNMEE